MKIVVASKNPVKVNAARFAFCDQYPNCTLQILPVTVESGISRQPRSDQETRQGAINRANRAAEVHGQADYWVGMEGGIEVIGDRLMAFAWMAVRNHRGRLSEARSPTLPLPEKVGELIESGMELGEANDVVFSTSNSKEQGGAFGLLTNGLYTRQQIYQQTLAIAMIPFVNPHFSDCEKTS